MSTKPQTTLETGFPAHDDFVKYPVYKVVSVFKDSDKVAGAVEELRLRGFTADDIEAYCGWQGQEAKIFEGSRPGAWESFIQAVKHVGPERTYLERYEKHLKDGDCLIMVKVANKEQKARAAGVLHGYTNQRVTYFGLLAADEIQ